MEARNTLIAAQKNLYQIAQSQFAVNQLTVTDSERVKQTLSIRLNDSSKTAVPTVLSTYDKYQASSDNTASPEKLYAATEKIIAVHNRKPNERPSFVKLEKLTNAIKKLAPERSMKEFPELKPFYEMLPEIKEQAAKLAGVNNQRRYEQIATTRYVKAIIGRHERTETTDNKDIER